ncbi:MAG TPA: hypothetical protein DIU00_23310, partial [Phycisphaerales bacterium]|nr:hypothetical protein [Phycisphaerales bacterium]
DQPEEYEDNNTDTVSILLASADLAVTEVTAPTLAVGNPATIDVAWTVANTGTFAGNINSWTDRVVLSLIYGDRVIAELNHTGLLNVGESYSRNETIVMPGGIYGYYHLLVITDCYEVVPEGDSEANNIGESAEMLEVAYKPYSDLVVTSVVAEPTGGTGSPLTVTWTVLNQGIAATDTFYLIDDVMLSTTQDELHNIVWLGSFDHAGILAAGSSYTRTVDVILPYELAPGTYYVGVETGEPYESIHTDNNWNVSEQVEVAFTPTPDLIVTNIVSPIEVDSGTRVDIEWTVLNNGLGDAAGNWTDRVELQNLDGTKTYRLGEFVYGNGLGAGMSYTRREQFTLPENIEGSYRVRVTANAPRWTGGRGLYEGGATDNNMTLDDDAILINLLPHPDLQVQSATAPDQVTAGGTISFEFVIVNQGAAATQKPYWKDGIYLSLDDQYSSDDTLLGQFDNGAALAPGESYVTQTGSLVIPERMRGGMYIVVAADCSWQIDEYPNEDNNALIKSLYVEPLPAPDLVTSDVFAPDQAISGLWIEVRYTVTNLGMGPTIVSNWASSDSWNDTIWLTRDKNRPHPGILTIEDILLGRFTHEGLLEVGESYEQIVSVRIPQPEEIAYLDDIQGQWYITPWCDAYDVVLEDTLDANINPDDPLEIDSNNYKSRPITIIVTRPDMAVVSVVPDAQAYTGENITVRWTVENQGNRLLTSRNWHLGFYLDTSDDPDDLNHQIVLGAIVLPTDLEPGQSCSGQETYELSPASIGSYIIVKARFMADFMWQPNPDLNYENNSLAGPTNVTARPADLQVTNVTVSPEGLYSGDDFTVEWTVGNFGFEVWHGTNYWYDAVYLSTDPNLTLDHNNYITGGWFERLGSFVHSHDPQLGFGDSYTNSQQFTLPRGIDGPYYAYVFTNVGGRDEISGYNSTNSYSLRFFRSHVLEDISNNLSSAAFDVTYSEPDLQVTSLTLPAGQPYSGQNIALSWSVENFGARAAKKGWEDLPAGSRSWVDRVYLSKDPSLDSEDYYLGGVWKSFEFGAGQTYSSTANVTIPDGIEGDYYVLVFTDSNIDGPLPPGGPGISFDGKSDLILARVLEYRDEGNNVTAEPITIILTEPPDLQVSEVIAPDHIFANRSFEISYTVTNAGSGDTPALQSSWTDRIYLSRDELLDMKSDIFLEQKYHSGVLTAGADYQAAVGDLEVPIHLTGPFYVFVITDPIWLIYRPRADVFEGQYEYNNATPSPQPMIIESPPPADLIVQDISMPASAQSGDTIEVTWTVTNTATEPAIGSWIDSAYLSSDAVWDIRDSLIGRVRHTGDLAQDESYTSTLETILGPVRPGQYHIIVRADIFNRVYEDIGEANNITASADTLSVSVDELFLDVPLVTTLSTGQDRLFQVEVGLGQTLRVTLVSDAQDAANELYLRYGDVPTGVLYDAAYEGTLQANQTAVIPTTTPGMYYVMIRGYYEPAPDTSVTLLAELMPFAITDVIPDIGGDSRYVTTTILGAQFHPDAIVKLVRPGIAEYEPVNYEVIDGTRIIAIFDLTDAPHGLYDVKVINPNGQEAIVPYRYLVERAIEPDVAIGMGGPRVIGLGSTGLYGFSLQSLTNVDIPYVYFQFGVPELGINYVIPTSDNSGLPYLDFSTNLRGSPEQGGLEDVPWAGLLSEVNTWGEVLAPGYIFDLADRDFTGLTFTAESYPGLKELLRENPFLLMGISPCALAFQFHILGTATVLTGDEFVARQSAEALALREQILADENASSSLMLLAADANGWVSLYLMALEDAGLLRPEDQAPSVREDPLVVSLMATLSTGILAGPAGQEIITDGDLVGFFEKVRQWYGHNDNIIADLDSAYPVIASLPDPDDYNLGLSSLTHFEAFNIYVPFGNCRLDVPPSAPLTPLDFASYFNTAGTIGELATIIGPVGFGPDAFLPVGMPLPYTIRFENDAAASSTVSEVQILTELDPNLDPRSFRLGDLQLGDIQVHIPSNRGAFQGDFDFSQSKGFILRLNAGIDLQSGTASWIIQAIDPETGELIQNPDLGLLPPNDADGSGAGFVTYTVKPKANTVSGTEISAQGRVLFNTMAPLDTNVVTHLIDGVAPVTTLTQTPLSPDSSDILVQWNTADDENGSGLKHVTVYVAEDGGDFKIWLRQTTETSAVYEGRAGHTYEFLALAMDNAGNKEKPTFGLNVPDDDSTVNLGGLPTVPETTVPGLGEAPEPSPEPSTNPLFLEAQLEIPASELAAEGSEFGSVLRPFNADAFATGIGQSHAFIGPMAIVVMPDGSVIISGGSTRGNLYKFSEYGGEAGVPIASLPYPVFDMALDADGNLWAATGGGPLLQLDPDTGAILRQFADGLTQTLAVDPDTGLIYISSSIAIEIFDPLTETFTHFSDVRVGNMAFSPSGQLWAAIWPNRGDVVRFNDDGVAELMLYFDTDVDSLAFGYDGSDLEGLLFISNNNGPEGSDGSELIMVDLATGQHVSVTAGGSRGDMVITTPDGKVLLSQSNQVDVLKPAVAPMVLYTNPPPDSVVALPRGVITVTFDQDMLLGNPGNPGSVLNTSSYRLFGQNVGFVDILSVVYDSSTKTAILAFDGLMPDQYIIQVLTNIQNNEGDELKEECISQFTAVSDFSSSLEIEFLTVRSDRQNQTVSYNVRVTNISEYDLVLPVLLVLDPAQYFDGWPLDADYQGEDIIWLIDLTDAMPVGGILQSGQSTNGYTVAIQNPTGQTITFEHGIFTLPVANQAPVFDSLPLTTATAGHTYQYQVLASDPDGLLLTYLLYDAPAGMTVNTDTGLVNWEPTSDSPSEVRVVLRVYDMRGGFATQEYSILVDGGNLPPVLNPIAAEYHGYEGQPLQVVVSAVDPDGDSLIFWADNLPRGAVFDTNTHALQWVPGSGDAGTYENVTFIVSDGVNQLAQTTTILIAPTNQAPILIVPSNRTAIEGQTVRLQLSGYDPEGHEIAFSSNAAPTGAVLDPNTGLFRWTIGYFVAGEYEIPFTVSDGELSSTGSIKITVTNVNAAPEFFDVTGWQVYEGQTIRQRVFCYDPDNPAYIPQDRLGDGSLTPLEGSLPSVTYSLSALPAGAAFDFETWMFEWIPTFDQTGDYIVTFTATDDGDGTGVNLFTSIDVPIAILNFNRPPEIADISNQQVNRGEVLDITVNATDPDGDLLVLTAENAIAGYALPDFATFTDNGDGTASLRFEPDFDHRGDYVIRITATDDGNGQPSAALSDDYTFVVSVLSPNEAPRMSYIGDKVAVIGQTLEFTIYVSDLDEDTLTFDADGLIAGASLTAGPAYGTAVFSWSPGIVDVGTHVTTFRVTDSGNGDPAEVLSDEETINIIVRGTNAAPVLNPAGDQTTSEAQELSVILSADDPDGDALTYYASNLPAGAEFDPAAGILTWSPGLFQAGIYQNIVLGVTDGNKSSSETITITVNNTNQAPVFLSVPEQHGQEGTALQ